MKIYSYLILIPLLAAVSIVCRVEAKEFIPRFGFGVESHTNINRGNEDPSTNAVVSDTILEPYVGFLFSEEVDKINSEISFQLEHQQYADNTFGAQNFFTIDGFLDYEIVPGRFVWATEDSANTRRIILQGPSTPDNLQTFNVFTTGPDLFFTRGANEIVVKGRVGDVHYSDQLADNFRILGSAAVTRDVSEVTRMGLDLSASLVRFQQDFQVDYDLAAILARIDRETPWGSLRIAGGYNVIDFENGFHDTEPVVEASLVVGEDSGNIFTLSASQKFSDPALDVFDPIYTRLFEVDGVGTVDSNERAGTGAFKSQRLEASFEHRGDLYSVRVFGTFQDLDRPVSGRGERKEEEEQEKQEELGVGVNLGYALTHNLNIWGSYFQLETDLLNSATIQDDDSIPSALATTDIHVEGKSVAAGINWSVTNNLRFIVGAKLEEDDSQTADRRFKDETVFVSLQYQGQSRSEK